MAPPNPAPLPNASATVRGAVTADDQTFGGRKRQIDAALVGSPARLLLHPEVNVLDFGADPTGVTDSQPAFLAAINSFSASGSSVAGTVIVPSGTFRFSSTLHIKKCVHIRGSHIACVVKPDEGITPFIFERYNMPIGTTDSATSD